MANLESQETHTDQVEEDRSDESHRGAFGEYGGEAGGLIDRAFREKIVVVGMQLPQ